MSWTTEPHVSWSGAEVGASMANFHGRGRKSAPSWSVVKKTALREEGESPVFSVAEFLNEVRRIVVEFVVGRVLKKPEGEEASSGLDPLTAYYLLHRNDFGMGEAPAGACILYATACGTTDGKLASAFILKTGKTKTLPSTEDESEEDSGEAGDSGGKFRLLKWSERTHASLGVEGRAGRPVPVIDRIHRIMQLWAEGDRRKLDGYIASCSATVAGADFGRVIQALVELCGAESPKGEESTILQSISNYIQQSGGAQPARRFQQGSLL